MIFTNNQTDSDLQNQFSTANNPIDDDLLDVDLGKEFSLFHLLSSEIFHLKELDSRFQVHFKFIFKL